MPNPCGMIDAPRHLLPTMSLSAVLLLSVGDVSAIFRIDVFAIKRFGVCGMVESSPKVTSNCCSRFRNNASASSARRFNLDVSIFGVRVFRFLVSVFDIITFIFHVYISYSMMKI